VVQYHIKYNEVVLHIVFALRTNELMPYSSVSGTCSWLSSLIRHAPDDARSKSNSLVSIISHSITFHRSVLMIRASGLSLWSIEQIIFAWSASISHALFRMMTFANSIWSSNKSAIVLVSFSSSISHASVSVSILASCDHIFTASTIVTIVSSLVRCHRSIQSSSSLYEKVCAIGSGSDKYFCFIHNYIIQ